MCTRFDVTKGWFLLRRFSFVITAGPEPASAGKICWTARVLFVFGGYWFCVCPGKYCLSELAASLKCGRSRWTVTGGKRVHGATAFLHHWNRGNERAPRWSHKRRESERRKTINDKNPALTFTAVFCLCLERVQTCAHCPPLSAFENN